MTKETKVQIGIRLPKSEKESLEIVAEHNGRSVNGEVLLLIRKHLNQVSADEEIQQKLKFLKD